jgi:hypothetical protein
VSNTFVTVLDAADATKQIDAFSIGSDYRQVVILGDSSTDAAVAAIKNTAPGVSDYGLVVRRPPLGLPHHLVSAGSTNQTSIKNTAGVIHSVSVFNNAAYPVFVKYFNKASAPSVGSDTPVWTIGVQAGVSRDVTPPLGLLFSTGIAMAIVKGIADNNSTAVVLSDCVVDTHYE